MTKEKYLLIRNRLTDSFRAKWDCWFGIWNFRSMFYFMDDHLENIVWATLCLVSLIVLLKIMVWG